MIGERLGTFEPEPGNVLEQIVEKAHVHASKTKEQLYLLDQITTYWFMIEILLEL
jgi:hypothetical protein